MSGGRPKLEVVPGGAAADAPRQASDAPAEEQPKRNYALWALIGALVLLTAGLVYENRRAAELTANVQALEGAVTGLEAALSAAEANVSAHREHLGDVRAFVDQLSVLVQRDPEAAH